jgi:hypothetical protein
MYELFQTSKKQLATRAGWEPTIKTLGSPNLLAKPITVDEVAIFN